MHMENLGDYNLLRQLGLGAFGQVYLAEHRFIKRPFALKILPEDLCSDAAFMRRFEEQVHAIAALDHPNIVKIHNITCADGRFFIVSDPIVDSLGETMNLDRYLNLKGRSLSEEDYLSILRQVASALDYCHGRTIGGMPMFHGSIKLTNLLVAPAEEGIRIVLSDFALTRLIGEGVAFSRLCEQVAMALMPQNLSTEKAVQSSRNYVRAFGFLAPEQKMLDAESGDLKADAYAFGTLAYYLVARKMPDGCFDLPSRVFPEAQGNWDYLISRCLQMNPALRPGMLSHALSECMKAPKVQMGDMLSLSEIERKLDSVLQMSFEFHPEKESAPAPVLAPVSGESPKPMLRPGEIARPEFDSDPAEIFHRDMHVSQYVPKKVELKEIDPMLTEMAVIPGGTYQRGSNEGARDEMPRHPITLSSFALDIHPVTNEQFVRFLQAMGGEKDSNNNDIIRLRDSRIKRSTGKLIIESGYAKHPVVGVTWYGAVAYAKWIGKRLPTEAEWETAASSGRENILFPTGHEIERAQANFFSSDTTAVMSYPTNEMGLYDMAGNVYEWCQDWYAYNYYDASALEPENPLGPPQGVYRVLRGGCWKSLKDDMRCSHRHRNNPGAMNGTYGFRCAADVQ
ncbi:MAG: pkn1 [Parachlamydiales bacterium]|nr:pkn1 [Parachlamydiales bacterium]